MIFLFEKSFFKKINIIPPILTLITNLAVSFLTRPFLSDNRIMDIATAFDKKIPFLPGFIYIYVLAFLQWAVCILSVMLIDREKSDYYCIGISVGNIIAGIIFVAFPTIMAIRPEYSGGGFTGTLVRFIFAADNPPLNLFPSIHCLFSWGVMRMLFSVKRVPVPVKIFNAVFSCLVFLSVLFVKQHVIYDIPAGILAFEAGLFIAGIIFSVKNKRKGKELV